jgi:hypothetical protein
MKKIAFYLSLLLFTACGSAKPETADVEKNLNEIMQTERRLVVSIQRKDIETLNQIWDDEYLGTTPNGRVITKADLIQAVKDDVLQVEETNLSDLKLRIFGNVGVVTGATKIKVKVADEDFSGSYRGTGIFIKRADGWHPVGVHVSPADWKPGQK